VTEVKKVVDTLFSEIEAEAELDLDQVQHYKTSVVVDDEKGGAFIKESLEGNSHGQLFGPSNSWLSVKLIDLSLESRVIRREGKQTSKNEVIIGSGEFETLRTNKKIDIWSVSLLGTSKEALKGNVTIKQAKPEDQGINFEVNYQDLERGVINNEEDLDWHMYVFVSAEEFSEILDAMQNRRLDGITIKFRAANHPQIFDDTKHGVDSKNFGIKLLTNLDYLELDVDQEELPINWQNLNDFTTDFTILVYTNKTVL